MLLPIYLQAAPRDVDDLVGIRASSGERELEDRGYKLVKSDKGDDRIWSNWWNGSKHKCITVVTRDGRYDSITDTMPADCDRKHSSDNSHSDRNGEYMMDMRITRNVKRNSADYKSFNSGSLKNCVAACVNDQRCQSFNFGKEQKDCHLKDNVVNGVSNDTVISGVK